MFVGYMPGLVAIVGRPNVGKSALFNRIAGKRIAIVHDQPGVTRDRVTAAAEWNGCGFTLVDTGGIGLAKGEKASDVITGAALEQVKMAIEAADVILFTVNTQDGVVPLDREVAQLLRESNRKVLLAANKSDHDKAAMAANEFSELGFDRVYPVSAIHGMGIDALMTATLRHLPKEPAGGESPTELTDDEDLTKRPLRIAIVGRPNVGKSSLINKLTSSERVIVSPIPGTTRDAVDVPFEIETEGVRERFVLVDTAGLRPRRHVDDTVEFFSVKRTEEAIERADLCVLVLDAQAGVSAQDKKIGGKIIESRKACVVVVNKWDLVEEDVQKIRDEELARRKAREGWDQGPKRMTTLPEFAEWVQKNLFFMDYAPVIFTSAVSGFHMDRLLESIRYVNSQLKQRVPTAILNRTLNDAIEKRQPVSSAGHHLKFYYATQTRLAPPTFLLFVNRDELFSPQYEKYLGNCLRTAFGYEGCPIVFQPRARPKTIDPVRKTKFAGAGDAGRRRGSENRRPGRRMEESNQAVVKGEGQRPTGPRGAKRASQKPGAKRGPLPKAKISSRPGTKKRRGR